MKKLRYLILLLIVLAADPADCFSQFVIPASGGNISATAGTVNYTIGQIILAEAPGTNGILIPGIQQSFEMVLINSIPDGTIIDLNIVTYPNPARDFIRLNTTNSETGDLSFRLYNLKGDLLISNKVDSDEMNINMTNYAPGTYFINVYRKSEAVRTFKIIKN
jgi:hypothetical protein